jgi:hydrogenase maturation protease
MTPIRILGVGSPFGHDRVGWDAIDTIDSSGLLTQYPKGEVGTEKCDRPGSLLLCLMQGARAVIIIDAMQSSSEPGTLHRLKLQDLDNASSVLSSHGFGVVSALSLGSALGDLPGQVIIYGIEIECFTNTREQSEINIPQLQAALVSALKKDLDNWCSQCRKYN